MANIQTEFNIGDKVFFRDGDALLVGVIYAIHIAIRPKKSPDKYMYIDYDIWDIFCHEKIYSKFPGEYIFTCIEDALRDMEDTLTKKRKLLDEPVMTNDIRRYIDSVYLENNNKTIE